MVVNGPQGVSNDLFLEFLKNSNFWVFGGHFKVKICIKFDGIFFGRV